MAAAQRVFRFSLFESCALLFVAAAALFFVFVLGIRVGSEIQGYESARETRAIRLPVGTEAEEKSKDVRKDSPINKRRSKSDLTHLQGRPLASTTATERVERDGYSVSTSWEANKRLSKNQRKSASRYGDLFLGGRPNNTAVLERQYSRTVPNEPKDAPKQPATLFRSGEWKIQVHVTESLRHAEEIAGVLRSRGYSVSINNRELEGRTLYRLRVGGYTHTQAQAVALSFRRDEEFGQAYLVTE